MKYSVDLGYDFVEDKHIKLMFTALAEANEFANEVCNTTGEILSIESEK